MDPKLEQGDFGTPFSKMQPAQKLWWLCRLAICLISFGMIYPNIQFQD